MLVVHFKMADSENVLSLEMFFSLRTVCCKDRLSVYKIEKTDFPKLCQNKGLGELPLKIKVSFCLELYLFWGNFFKILPMEAG